MQEDKLGANSSQGDQGLVVVRQIWGEVFVVAPNLVCGLSQEPAEGWAFLYESAARSWAGPPRSG